MCLDWEQWRLVNEHDDLHTIEERGRKSTFCSMTKTNIETFLMGSRGGSGHVCLHVRVMALLFYLVSFKCWYVWSKQREDFDVQLLSKFSMNGCRGGFVTPLEQRFSKWGVAEQEGGSGAGGSYYMNCRKYPHTKFQICNLVKERQQ